MLNMLPSDDKKLLDRLSFEIFAKAYSGNVGYIFYNDGEPVGLAKIEAGDISSINSIGILPQYRNKGYGDFFTRSILYRFTQISSRIRIDYTDDYYTKFGFRTKEKGMEISSDKLVFSDCHC